MLQSVQNIRRVTNGRTDRTANAASHSVWKLNVRVGLNVSGELTHEFLRTAKKTRKLGYSSHHATLFYPRCEGCYCPSHKAGGLVLYGSYKSVYPSSEARRPTVTKRCDTLDPRRCIREYGNKSNLSRRAHPSAQKWHDISAVRHASGLYFMTSGCKPRRICGRSAS